MNHKMLVFSLPQMFGIRFHCQNLVTPYYSSRTHHFSCAACYQRSSTVAGGKDQNGSASSTVDIFPEKSKATMGRCPRPRRIILVRHGQSQGNVDESAYTQIPDPKVEPTEKGWRDAERVGRKIREIILKDGSDDWKVYFYVSPYTRSLQTLRGLGRAFERERITGVREEPRLREQDFGIVF